MIATSYNIQHVGDKLIRFLLNEIILFLECNLKEYDLYSIYIIGSSVGSLTGHRVENDWKDIDIAAFVVKDFERGNTLICTNEFNLFTEYMYKKYSLSLSFNYNGIPISEKDEPIFDIIPVKKTDVVNKFPPIVIDMCNRDNIYIYGEECLKSLMNYTPDLHCFIERMNITENYIEREIQNNSTARNHLIAYCLKCFGYSLQLINLTRLNLTSKQAIESFINANKNLPDDLLKLYNSAGESAKNYNFNRLFHYYKQFNEVVKIYLTERTVNSQMGEQGA